MPAQTRGFLFSDLRGYSAFTERHGDRAARELLARYRRVVREAIPSLGGAEIRTEGDSFYVVFASVSAAVEAGLAIQAGLAGPAEGDRIRAGIGIHAGEVEDDAEQGIVSGAVNIAARICAAADAGEVLVSETVRALTRSYLDVTYIPRGRRKLKGIADPVVVYGALPPSRAGAGHHQLKRAAVRARWGTVPVVGMMLVLVAVSAVVGGTLLRESWAGDTHPSEGLNSPADVQSSQPPSPTASASSEPASFPTIDEQRLTALVDQRFQPSCERAAPDSVPPIIGPGDSANNWTVRQTPVFFRAGITCAPFGVGNPDELAYWKMSAAGHVAPAVVSADEWIANRAGWLEIRRGSCREDRRALEEWDAGPISGFLLCFSTSSLGSVLYWTYNESDVLGRAVAADGDLDALLAWWQREARFQEP